MSISKRELVLGFLTVLSAALIGFWWKDILENPYRALSVLVFATLWSLSALLIRSKQVRYTIAVVSAGIIAITLGVNIVVLMGSILGMLGFLWASAQSEQQYQNTLTIAVRPILGKNLRVVFTSLAIIFSFAYYQGVSEDPSGSTKLFLPEDVFALAFKIAVRPLQNVAPGISADSTLDETLAIFLQQQLQKEEGFAPTLAEIKTTLPAHRKDLIRAINEQLDISIDINTRGDEKISKIFYQISEQGLNEYATQYSDYWPWLLSVGFFFALKALSIFPYYGAIIATSLCISLLLKIGIIKKESVSVTKEILV